MRIKEKLSLQHFDHTPPTRSDVLDSLALALSLLAESLPIAVNAIGAQPGNVQMRFWWALLDFENHTDMDTTGGFGDELALDQWTVKLNDWAAICYNRILTPTGDMTGADEVKS